VIDKSVAGASDIIIGMSLGVRDCAWKVSSSWRQWGGVRDSSVVVVVWGREGPPPLYLSGGEVPALEGVKDSLFGTRGQAVDVVDLSGGVRQTDSFLLIYFLHTHYPYAAPTWGYDDPPGNPGGFKGCQVNLARPRKLDTKITHCKENLTKPLLLPTDPCLMNEQKIPCL